MYKLIVFLLILIAALQYRLWEGDGSIREYREIHARIEELKQEGERRRIRNAAVAADVRDLREGTEAVEERARRELGMVRPGEYFVQIYDAQSPQAVQPTVDVSVKSPEKFRRALESRPAARPAAKSARRNRKATPP